MPGTYILSHCCVLRAKLHPCILWTREEKTCCLQIFRMPGNFQTLPSFTFVSPKRNKHSALYTDSVLFIHPVLLCDTISLRIYLLTLYGKQTTGTCWVRSVICETFLSVSPLLVSDLSGKIGLPWVPYSLWDGFYPWPLSCHCWYAFFSSVPRALPSLGLSFSISYTNKSMSAGPCQ